MTFPIETGTGYTWDDDPEFDLERHAGWWAVHTRHHHEQSVKGLLAAKGLEVFLPMYEALRQWSDRKKPVNMPLFPCYLFVRVRADARLPIVTTPGVRMIVTRGPTAAVVADNEVRAIMQAVHKSSAEPHPYLSCGERVRVVRGPMRGIEGILLRTKGTCRLIVSVELLTQSASVEVDSEHVETIASTPQSLNEEFTTQHNRGNPGSRRPGAYSEEQR